MRRQIVLRTPASVYRRQRRPSASSTASVGEMAGGTTAECAAIWCCPCGLVNLLVLVACKLPARLCRQALKRKRRQRLIKQGFLNPKGHRPSSRIDEMDAPPVTLSDLLEVNKPAQEVAMEVAQLEKEMWERFYGAGFWRSSSRRD
ncbi:hypothetical protein SAY87_030041 [Trapa incisa]|uniref:Uncharacterized protein n=1 Tax=Trapa incisa TaxID=236973 RepID=A0AAN7KE73_9MYRT|nr:hypothetical protein SAY87_030041 [Trapa incisa]